MLRLLFLDFDGVVVESGDIKDEAFAALFSDHPAHVPAILDLHRSQGGIGRRVKFEQIHREILDLPFDQTICDQLADRFAELVVEKVVACPMVPGMAELLAQAAAQALPVYVVSGTPEGELREIIARRGLSPAFSDAFGTPRTKPEIIASLLSATGIAPQDTLLIGDAETDYTAAMQTQIPFLGRVAAGSDSPFPAGTKTVPDFLGIQIGALNA